MLYRLQDLSNVAPYSNAGKSRNQMKLTAEQLRVNNNLCI